MKKFAENKTDLEERKRALLEMKEIIFNYKSLIDDLIDKEEAKNDNKKD